MRIVEINPQTRIGEATRETVIKEYPGRLASDFIDDGQAQGKKAYSSQKTEARLGEEVSGLSDAVGETETDLVVLFENILSQGATS